MSDDQLQVKLLQDDAYSSKNDDMLVECNQHDPQLQSNKHNDKIISQDSVIDQQQGFISQFALVILAAPRSVWNSGPWSITVSAFMYSITLLGVKLIDDKVQVFQILITRSFVGMIICLFIQSKTRKGPLFGKCENFRLLFARGVFGSCAFLALYYALSMLPLGDASAIFFLNATFTTIFAWIILKQPISAYGVAGILSSFVGVVFVSNPPFLFGGHEDWGPQRLEGVLCAVLAAVLAGMAFTFIRAVGSRETAITLSIWFHGMSLILGTIPVVLCFPFPPVLPNLYQLFILSIICFGSFLAQLMLNRGFQQDKASKIAAIYYLEVVFNYAWGLIILHEALTWLGGVGVAFVALGVFLVNKKKQNEDTSRTERIDNDVRSSNQEKSTTKENSKEEVPDLIV
eukprot:TRINITY_DN1646_c0_g1_i6.p1 TRINITY_DN1646_c0_g1~~TRINITY_DN1646_c0_g1_i6.p1  ORF type:complete len:401 (-),score=21.58 TRINITY_DN1646_c0_g1_i6:581-1783(-)